MAFEIRFKMEEVKGRERKEVRLMEGGKSGLEERMKK